MAEPNRRSKKNIFINKGLQFRIIMTSMIYMFAAIIVTTGVILFPLIYDMISSSDIKVQYEAAQKFLLMATRLMPATVVLFALFFFHQLFITHRICGPLVNFSNAFRRISTGDLTTRVTLRRGDYLKHECEIVNTMIEGLSDHFSRLSANHEQLIRAMEDTLTEISDPGTRSHIESILAESKQKSRLMDIPKTS